MGETWSQEFALIPPVTGAIKALFFASLQIDI